MRGLRLLAALIAICSTEASETVFSVNDDVLAYPQYDIVFSESFISEENAAIKLRDLNHYKDSVNSFDSGVEGQLSRFHDQNEHVRHRTEEDSGVGEQYQHMILDGRDFLCSIPQVVDEPQDTSTKKTPEVDGEKDLATAAKRGWELLQDMDGKPCLFYSTGWWSYSFCYNSHVKQFHALPPGTNGGPSWPPVEDHTTPSYVLGKLQSDPPNTETKTEIGELQTKAETRYLVQRLGGGTACDLTGKERKVEVQFHCHPQSTDRIGWIKETATCAYLMIIYTPRLCNDITFLPPRETKANPIACQEILRPDQVSEWETRKTAQARKNLIGETMEQRIFVGDVEVGGKRHVGSEGRKIERGRVVLTADERAETVMIQKDGQLQSLSRAEMKKMELNPEDVESFRKEIQKLAGSRDWRIERHDDINGQIQLKGVVSNDGIKKEDAADNPDEGVEEAEEIEEAGETDEEYIEAV